MSRKSVGLMCVWLLSGLNAAVAAPVSVDISAFTGTALNIEAEADALLTDQFSDDGLVISGGATARDQSLFMYPPEAGSIGGASVTLVPTLAISERITFGLSATANLFGGYFSWNPNRILRFEIWLGTESLGSLDFINDRINSSATFVGISNLSSFDRVVMSAIVPDGPGRTSFGFDLLRFEAFPATEVPEPATLALLGLGLVGMGYARRRKAS